MNKRSKAVWEYNKENTVQVALRLNKNTDADVIRWLNAQKNKQGYIKELIRQDIDAFCEVNVDNI